MIQKEIFEHKGEYDMKKENHKTIFDKQQFKYLTIPVEIFRLDDLNCAEKMVLARIHYWSKKNTCYETNEQLGQLIGRSASQASRIVRKLRERNYVECFYPNKRTRQIYSKINSKTDT